MATGVDTASELLVQKLVEGSLSSYATTFIDFLTFDLFLGSVLCFLAGALCAGGGIGGGAFYIPVFVLLLGLDPHEAVPLSKITTFGIAVGGYIVNVRKRHPSLNRPLIYYDLAMLMEPTTLIGTVIGVYLNVISPAYIILVCLLLLLSWTSYETLKKAVSTYKAETKAEQQSSSSIELQNIESEDDVNDDDVSRSGDGDGEEIGGSKIGSDDVNEKLISDRNDDDNNNGSDDQKGGKMKDGGGDEVEIEIELKRPFECLTDDDDNNVDGGEMIAELMEMKRLKIEEEESKTPIWKNLLLIVIWIGFFIIILLKGGSSSGESIIGVECGTWAYWLIVFTEIPYLFAFVFAYGVYLRFQQKKKEEVHYVPQKGDVIFTTWNSTWLPIASVLAGVAAGFLGIGGGMVKGPIMLAINVIPQVATATSSFMILFTSSATSIQFMILGKLPLNYAVWYFFVGVFAAVVGQLALAAIIKKYKKQSYVGFLLGICIVLSAVAMAGMIVLDMVEGRANLTFQPICGSSVDSS